MQIFKAYKFRLYPNKDQTIQINKTFGCTRYIYNYFLNEMIKYYKQTHTLKSLTQLYKELDSLYKTCDWLKEIYPPAIQTSINNLIHAFSLHKNKTYPKFKSKTTKQSYKIINTSHKKINNNFKNIKLNLKNKTITLPWLNEVKIRGYRNLKYINGNIKSATISKEADKYFISVLVAQNISIPKNKPTSIVGIDLGIKDMIVTSNNEKIQNTIRINEQRIKGLQKSLARKQKGSKNYNKTQLKLQRMYLKIKNARKYLIHNITNNLLKDNDIIVTENLNIKQMYKTHSIAKSLNKTPLAKFLYVLKYKTKWQGKTIIQINRYYPSSQTCSVCDYKNIAVKNLSVREWECPKCHVKHDRDVNASINILFEGLKIYLKTFT